MPIITVTQADIMKTKVIDPGIYGAEIVKVHPLETAKAGGSINQRIDFEIEKQNGKQIQVVFNSLLLGKIAPLAEAALGKKFEAGQFDTDVLAHKKVDVKVGTRVYEGNMMNEISDYYPYGQGASMNQVPFG